MILLDTKAEINVMNEILQIKTNLPMQMHSKMHLIIHIGERIKFLGFCENVEVNVGGVKIYTIFFVVKGADKI